MSNVSCILMSCLYYKWSLETMDEHQQNWMEMTLTMMKINKESKKMFNIVHVFYQVRNYFKTILK